MAAANSSSNVTTDPGSQAVFVMYITGEVVLAALTAAGNGLVIVAIFTRPQLQTVTNYFVASLAAADFLVGVFGIPCAVISFVGLYQDYISCVMVNMIIIILTQISMFGLCAVAIERFVAIKYPYKYAESCTVKMCIASIITIWVMGIVVGVIPLMIFDMSATYDGKCAFTSVIDLRHMVYVHFFVCLLVPLTFMFAIYCYIFHVVRQQIRRIAAVQQMAASDARTTATFKKDTRAAKWFAVVILFFALSWFPLDIMNVITLFGGPTCVPCLLVAIILSHANSAINPLLYAFANSKFKIAFKQMLYMKKGDMEDSVTDDARQD